MCSSSRVIKAPVNGKNQWQMFLLRYGRHIAAPPQWSSKKLRETFLAIIIVRMNCTDLTFGEVVQFENTSCAISQILDFIDWIITTFFFIFGTPVKSINWSHTRIMPNMHQANCIWISKRWYKCEQWNQKTCWAFKPAVSESHVTLWNNLVFLIARAY